MEPSLSTSFICCSIHDSRPFSRVLQGHASAEEVGSHMRMFCTRPVMNLLRKSTCTCSHSSTIHILLFCLYCLQWLTQNFVKGGGHYSNYLHYRYFKICVLLLLLYQSVIVFCPRASLSLQTQHSSLYPLLSLPLCICLQSFT